MPGRNWYAEKSRREHRRPHRLPVDQRPPVLMPGFLEQDVARALHLHLRAELLSVLMFVEDGPRKRKRGRLRKRTVRRDTLHRRGSIIPKVEQQILAVTHPFAAHP